MTRSVFNHRRASALLLAADSFNRSGGLGATDGQGYLDPLTWTVQSGTFSTDGSAANGTHASNNNIATVDLHQGDVVLVIVPASIGGSILQGFTFRYSDSTHYWRTFATTSTVTIQKVNGGTTTTFSHATTGTFLWTLTLAGSTISWVDGATTYTLTDSFNATATSHGLYAPGGAGTPQFNSWTAYAN